jgi:colanic acid biosynthesis glycosyl transferase WcaI
MNLLIHDFGGYAFSQQLARQLSQTHTVHYLYSASQLVQRCNAENTPSFTSVAVNAGRELQKYNLVQRLLWEREYGRQVGAYIRRLKPDVVISANTPLDSQVAIQSACKETGTRFIFWFQDAIGLAMDAILRKKIPVLGGFLGSYYQRMERKLLLNSQSVILISPSFEPLMLKWGITRTTVIPNWAPLEEIPVLSKQNNWSRQHGLDETINLMYSGILGYKHSPELFIALAQHFAGDPRVRVVVISEGGGADWLRAKQIDLKISNLVLLPFQPTGVYPQVLACADVLLSIINTDAARYSIPSKVLTYLCAGRSLLLSMPRKNDAAVIVEFAGAGLVNEPGDIPGWLEKADRLVNDQSTRQQMGLDARTFAETNFNLDMIVNKFDAIFSI